MERIDKSKFEGKTIEKVVYEAINVVEFHFTDGTKAELECAVMSLHGIPTIFHNREGYDGV